MFNRLPGYVITEYTHEEFGSESFYDMNDRELTVEGRKTVIRYDCDGEAAPLKVVRNFTNAIQKLGGTSREYSGNTAYLHYIKGNYDMWAQVYAEPTLYILTIVEKGDVVQEITANSLYDELTKTGKAILYINFDSGKATIKTESKPVIDEIVKLMADNPELKLSIEGHTDNVGTDESNLILSQNRAKSVTEAVISGGIDNSRLQSKGYGELKPIADNKTDEGKAKNRRVELIKL